jgi:hypothetical protein
MVIFLDQLFKPIEKWITQSSLCLESLEIYDFTFSFVFLGSFIGIRSSNNKSVYSKAKFPNIKKYRIRVSIFKNETSFETALATY